jgi:hypothetical protein
MAHIMPAAPAPTTTTSYEVMPRCRLSLTACEAGEQKWA